MIIQRQFTILPITCLVVACVNELGKHDDVPHQLTFADLEDLPEDDSDIDDYESSDDKYSEYALSNYVTDNDLTVNESEITGVDDEDNDVQIDDAPTNLEMTTMNQKKVTTPS